MSRIEEYTLLPEQEAVLLDLTERANEVLESGAQESTNRAFNLGFSVGLLPAALTILVVFLLSRGSWVAAAITALLMVIALLGFASLAASIARTNTLDRLYQQEVLLEIERVLAQESLSRLEFDQFVSRTLPAGTLLSNYLSIPDDVEQT